MLSVSALDDDVVALVHDIDFVIVAFVVRDFVVDVVADIASM